MIQILKQDNIVREIPQVDRDNLELDIKGGLDNKKLFLTADILLQVQCLNLVRKVLDQDPLIGDIKEQIKAAGPKGLETLLWVTYFILIFAKLNSYDYKLINLFLIV